ncbi:unnamed protein product [Phytomonas sp. Hart1]|nr:unnamed protein product [Phytomonas sp. Hart1]|eukprot:CCW70151.1 unnamed protein product [Phytomonas sp. isolate Hart1]
MNCLDKKKTVHSKPRASGAAIHIKKKEQAIPALHLHVNGVSIAHVSEPKMKKGAASKPKPAEKEANESLRDVKASPRAFGSFQPGAVHEYEAPFTREENGENKDSKNSTFMDFTVLEKHPKGQFVRPPSAPHAKNKKPSKITTHQGYDENKSLSTSSRAKLELSVGSNPPTMHGQFFLDAKAIMIPRNSESHPERNQRTSKAGVNSCRNNRVYSVCRPRYDYEYCTPHPYLSRNSARRARSSRASSASFNPNAFGKRSPLSDPKSEEERDEKREKVSSCLLSSPSESTTSVKMLGPLNPKLQNELIRRPGEVFSAVKYAQMATDVQNRRPIREFSPDERDAKPNSDAPKCEVGGGSTVAPGATLLSANGKKSPPNKRENTVANEPRPIREFGGDGVSSRLPPSRTKRGKERHGETLAGEGDYRVGLQDSPGGDAPSSTPRDWASFHDDDDSRTARSVILHDSRALLACEPLAHDAPGSPGEGVGEADPNNPERAATLILKPASPRREAGVTLSHAARTLLAILLYLRALGGLPRLLRITPLPCEGDVVGKEDCLELVFLNPPRSLPGEREDRRRKRAKSGLPRYSSAGEVYTRDEGVPMGEHSLLGQLSRTLSNIGKASLEQSPKANPERELASKRKETSLSSLTGNAAFPTAISQMLPPKTTRTSYSPTFFDFEEGADPFYDGKIKRKGLCEDPLMVNGKAHAAKATYRRGHRLSPRSRGPAGDRAEETAKRWAGSRDSPVFSSFARSAEGANDVVFDAAGEVSVVVRAVLADRRRVRGFGREEVVHVLPPLLPDGPPAIPSTAGGENSPAGLMWRLGLPDAANSFRERRRRARRGRPPRPTAPSMIIIPGEGKLHPPSSADFGDFAVVLLKGREVDGEELPSAEGLGSWRYRMFDLRDYAGDFSRAGRWEGARWVGAAGANDRNPPHTARGNPPPSSKKDRIAMKGAGPREIFDYPADEDLPCYRAATVSETTLRHSYHDVQALYGGHKDLPNSKNRRPTPPNAALYSSMSSFSLGSPRQGASSARGVAEDAVRRKILHLRKAERDFLPFRPFHLNGFHNELDLALQHMIDAQV